ncbi:MAG: hypothetical protein AAGH78_10185 [Cyanobacteria bacterium P01_H01_bin.58]
MSAAFASKGDSSLAILPIVGFILVWFTEFAVRQLIDAFTVLAQADTN